jgi:hypothetical protein
MQLDEIPDDAESEADAVAGRVDARLLGEGLEDARQELRRNAPSAVGDHDTCIPGGTGQAALDGAAPRRELQPVGDQVRDDPAQVSIVPFDDDHG